jgi:ParB-like chromosome segregation protein Spo0J
VPEFRQIKIELIIEPAAPMRASMDETALAELAADIRLRGVLQPLVVVPAASSLPSEGEGGAPGDVGAQGGLTPCFEIVAGHRRYLAARMAGLAQLPCMVHERSDEFIAAAKIAENIMREGVTAAEEGWFFLELVEQHGWSEDMLCSKLGKSPDYIAERIRLVRNDAEIAGACAERKIEYSVARELLRVNVNTAALVIKCRPEEVDEANARKIVEHRHFLLRLAIEGGANARQVRSWVEQWKQTYVPAGTPSGDGTAPAPGGAPAANPLTCIVCQCSHDPHNLVSVFVHFWELELFKRACREATEAARGGGA